MTTSLLFCLGLSLAQGPSPIAMIEREPGPPTKITGGKEIKVEVGSNQATLFIPDGWKATAETPLWVHFHSAPWYVVSEYQRARSKDAVAIFDLGQGSSVYAKPFPGPGSFAPWLKKFEELLGTQVNSLHFTSFSAGYGAVRNLIADPAVLAKLKTVILADSMYGSLQADAETRIVDPEHVQCWFGLVEKAVSGKATVIMTTSQITPDTYAGTWELALALVKARGGEMIQAKSTEGTQPLLRSFSKGRWFVWSYSGESAVAHMTHARRLAELIEETRK